MITQTKSSPTAMCCSLWFETAPPPRGSTSWWRSPRLPGSTRSSVVRTGLAVCVLGRTEPVPTQSEPPPTAMSSGVALVPNGWRSPLAGSTREMVRSSELSTQTAPSPTATAVGVAPTAKRRSTLPEPGSIAATASSVPIREACSPPLSRTAPATTAATTAAAATAASARVPLVRGSQRRRPVGGAGTPRIAGTLSAALPPPAGTRARAGRDP